MANENKVSTITKDQLLENGWLVTEGDEKYFFQLHKDLKDTEQEQDPDGECKLVVHNNYNTPMFALLISGGYMVNINPESIEELNAFENLIIGVDSPY